MAANARHQHYPIGNFDTTEMWRVGTSVRANRSANQISIHPITAGIYIAAIMAQANLLKEKGHRWNCEWVNYWECRFVLTYLHHRGMAFINNCSTTARLGRGNGLPDLTMFCANKRSSRWTAGTQPNEELFNQFLLNDIHQVLSVCAQLRPPGEYFSPQFSS